MTKEREIKIDVYLHTALILRKEVLNDYASEGGFIDEAMREQERLADELERRAEKLRLGRSPLSN